MNENLILFKSFDTTVEAEICSELLKSHEIASQLRGENAAGWSPVPGLATGGVSLWIHSEDQERVARLLAHDDGKHQDPLNRSEDESDKDASAFFGSDHAEHSPLAGKSVGLALFLTLLFGPLGLLYVYAFGAVVFGIALTFILSTSKIGGWWIFVGARILSACWAYHLIKEANVSGSPNREAAQLLEKGAGLENCDPLDAIAVYEEIIERFPSSPSSKEAIRNIAILKRLREDSHKGQSSRSDAAD